MHKPLNVQIRNETEAGFLKSLKEALLIGLSLAAVVMSTAPDDLAGDRHFATEKPGIFVLLDGEEKPIIKTFAQDWSLQLQEVETTLEASFRAMEQSKRADKIDTLRIVRHDDARRP